MFCLKLGITNVEVWRVWQAFYQRLWVLDSNWSCRKTEFWENLGPEFWIFVEFLHCQLVFQKLLCSKNLTFLPENWVLNKNLWVLVKILAEFWNFGSFRPAEFWRKCWKSLYYVGHAFQCTACTWNVTQHICTLMERQEKQNFTLSHSYIDQAFFSCVSLCSST